MTDARLVWDDVIGAADLSLAGADFESDDGLETAVILSLFTDRRIPAGDLPGGETDRRGWWGDALTDEGDLGSRLWLVAREKTTATVLARAEHYAREALAWLVEDGLASSVDVAASRPDTAHLRVDVTIDRRDAVSEEYQFTAALAAV